LILAAILIGIESIEKIQEPHPLPRPYTLWVLLAVVAIKLLLSRYVTSVGPASSHNAIISSFVLIGISAALWTRNAAADDWAALCAASIIIFNAWRQLRRPMAELLDATPSPKIEAKIRAIASKVDGVIGLEKCHVRKMGFRYCVDLHVIVDGEISVRIGHQIAHAVEDAILRSATQIAKVVVHVEPDGKDPEAIQSSSMSALVIMRLL
jgi:cation diffusion facilitator family transporter